MPKFEKKIVDVTDYKELLTCCVTSQMEFHDNEVVLKKGNCLCKTRERRAYAPTLAIASRSSPQNDEFDELSASKLL